MYCEKHTQERCETEQHINIAAQIKNQYTHQTTEQHKKMITNTIQEIKNTENEAPEQCLDKIKNYTRQESPELKGETTLQETDRQEYDDDALLFFETNKIQEMQIPLQHYHVTPKSRELKTQWRKVELLTARKKLLEKTLPRHLLTKYK